MKKIIIDFTSLDAIRKFIATAQADKIISEDRSESLLDYLIANRADYIKKSIEYVEDPVTPQHDTTTDFFAAWLANRPRA